MRRMKQSELKARKITVHEERYAPVLLLAFLLVLLEALLPEAWFARGSHVVPEVKSPDDDQVAKERAA